jgi:hypothetical protein
MERSENGRERMKPRNADLLIGIDCAPGQNIRASRRWGVSPHKV